MNDMTGRSCLTIILAAGDGKRMHSSLPKVLHPIAGLPMVGHVVQSAKALDNNHMALVVGNQSEKVVDTLSKTSPNLEYFEQKERLGTAHAVLAAREALVRGYDDVVILYGDVPLVKAETLAAMRRKVIEGNALCVLGFQAEDPDGYGRFIETGGRLRAIREHKDATKKEREIDICNGGIMAIDGKKAVSMLDRVTNENAQQEYYLTDLVEIANGDGGTVSSLIVSEEETMGVNNRAELAKAGSVWQHRYRDQLMKSGVTMMAPETVHLNHDTVISPDVVLEPNLVFGPDVNIESGATIRAFSHLEGATVASGSVVGPYARLRPGAVLKEGAKVGNFCEVKNATLESGAKVNHLTYIGDAYIGEKANIGAGTITCNYDGYNKHRTEIGSNAFIGSNSSLVAPVNIGDGAFVASGSVITDDVPDNAMGIGRGRQAIKEGYADEINGRNRLLKSKGKG